MNKHDINQEVQLPSDYLLENRNTLERLNGFDEMCEELDALQHEAMQYARCTVYVILSGTRPNRRNIS